MEQGAIENRSDLLERIRFLLKALGTEAAIMRTQCLSLAPRQPKFSTWSRVYKLVQDVHGLMLVLAEAEDAEHGQQQTREGDNELPLPPAAPAHPYET